jgi:hypothetical protein
MSGSGEIDKFSVELETHLRKFKEQFGIELLERTRARTPVRTGNLRDGWGFKLKDTSIEVYNTQPYATFVEYGTDKIAPRAMLRTSLAEADQITAVAAEKAGLRK